MQVQSESIPCNSDEIKAGYMRYEVVDPLNDLRIYSSGKFLRLNNPMDLKDPDKMNSKTKVSDFVDVEFDVTFSGWGEVHNFKNIYARGLARQMIQNKFGLKDLLEVRKVASEHYEQVGSYNGTIRVGRKKINIENASGHRDHSWGLRDWAAPKGWTWITLMFWRRSKSSSTGDWRTWMPRR